MMHDTKKTKLWRRAQAFLLALCLSLSLCPALSGTAGAVGEAAMDQLLNWGVVGGYPDGGLHPERSLTRAEFVAMINRAYGYATPGETPFTDVPVSAWYYDDIGIAYNANYFGGVSPRRAAPDAPLTREMAMVLLARNMRLDPVGGEVVEFSDGRSFADWSRGYARAASQMGLIGGYGDGSYKPQNNITRGEMGIMLQRALGTLINKPGTHTLSDVYGNVTISSTGATLKDTTVAGNLYITGGLDLGDITLDNVRVLGSIIVAGGGESNGGEDSIVLRNVEASSLLVDSIADQYVSLRAEGNTAIADTQLRSDAFVQDRTRPGLGLLNIALDSPDVPAAFTLSGNLETVVNKTPDSTLNIAMGTVDSLTVDEAARNSRLNLDINSTASALNLDTAVSVTGVGDVDRLYVNTAGSTVEMLPDTITIRPGLTANIAGDNLNAVQAQESSADPRLLASYPKVRNIAPTTATAAYSGNKAGTVYWAVSTTTDGSIGEEELIAPTEGNSAAIVTGTTPLAASNTEATAALTRLTPDGNYYLAAVMVDARDRHSPVKVTSFTTPDNTVPAFNQGYPVVTQNRYVRQDDSDPYYNAATFNERTKYLVQVSVMPNKSCQLYYALYPSGSTAPTAQQFRVGALGQPLKSGVEEATKNVVTYLDFYNLNSANLAELTSYDLYVCLIDADGSRSSAVRRLTFTTVDGTAPVFQYDTPELSGNPLAQSIPTRVNLSEASTVYWAAVRQGAEYTKVTVNLVQRAGESDAAFALRKAEAELEALKRKIESGAGSVSNGSQTVRGDTDAVVNVNGLASETAYDLYFVAKDNAGNYSDYKLLEGKRTLDVTPPTVRQVFTRVDEKDNPYASTDVELIFSENIATTITDKDGSSRILTSLLDVVKDDPDGTQLAKFLSNTVFLYNESSNSPSLPVESYTGSNHDADDWLIDYRNATVTSAPDSDAVTVTLSSANKSLKLRSDATYHFTFNNIQDLATTPNRMRNMPYALPSFTTVGASVLLRDDDIDATTIDNQPRAADGSNDIDMVFSVRPVSVNVENNKYWDMLLWSDSTVEFDLYSRVRGSSTYPRWDRVPAGGTAADSYISINEGTADMNAKSLYAHFLHQTQERVNTLVPDQVTEYAIHFTMVGDETERSKWNKTITFNVSIISGTMQPITVMTRPPQITRDGYATAMGSGVTEINNAKDESGVFWMRTTISDSKAPEFDGNYPMLNAFDTGVNVSAVLDRPGKIYYAVAKYTGNRDTGAVDYSLRPTVTDGDAQVTAGAFGLTNITGTTDYYLSFTETASGKTYKLSGGGSDSVAGAQPVKVSSPTVNNLINPRFGPNIITGSYTVQGIALEDFTINGLDADTHYIIYFAFESQGQIPSTRVVAYQFKTAIQSGPKLNITRPVPSTVTVESTNMDAIVDYAVFQMTSLPEEFNRLFADPYDVSKDTTATMAAAEWAEFKNTYDTIDNRDIYGITVYEAMSMAWQVTDTSTTPASQISLFDKYASDSYKDAVARLIRSNSGDVRFSGDTMTVSRNTPTDIDCVEKLQIKSGENYLFAAVARRTNTAVTAVRGDSLGFGSYAPVYVRDTSQPKIESITGTIRIDHRTPDTEAGTSYTVSGSIDLHFDRPLYYYTESTNTRLPIVQVLPTANPANYRLVTSLLANPSSRDGLAITPDTDATPGAPTQDIYLSVNRLIGTITLTGQIAAQYGGAIGSQPQITVTSLLGATKASVEVSAVNLLADNPYINVNIVETQSQVAVTGVQTSTGTVPLEIGQTADVSAYVMPTNATNKTLYWSITDGTAYASISRNVTSSGDSVTITGLAEGTAKITVYDSTYTKSQTITVNVTRKRVQSISLDKTRITLRRSGGSDTVTATVLPADAYDRSVTWTLSNNAPLSYSVTTQADGSSRVLITPLVGAAAGDYYLTVTTNGVAASGSQLSAQVTVTVLD